MYRHSKTNQNNKPKNKMNHKTFAKQVAREMAKELSAIYKNIGVSGTQSIRNLEPAHVTIVKCLPSCARKSINVSDLYAKFVQAGGLATRASFNVTLARMVKTQRVNIIRYSNVPFSHYFFGF